MSLSEVLKALGDPTRRRIVHMLRERPLTAGEISSSFEISKPSVSFHLSQLKEAGLIYGERDGTTITYHLNLSILETLLAFATDLWEGKGHQGAT
ncbi:MAG: winged helix-turn-helix domain-containing protein [Cyanobacteria bacterium REEB65]|nr:winged helix-turn-helix domain-containing protein [Cyanobacteria bacterium REEB65]